MNVFFDLYFIPTQGKDFAKSNQTSAYNLPKLDQELHKILNIPFYLGNFSMSCKSFTVANQNQKKLQNHARLFKFNLFVHEKEKSFQHRFVWLYDRKKSVYRL